MAFRFEDLKVWKGAIVPLADFQKLYSEYEVLCKMITASRNSL